MISEKRAASDAKIDFSCEARVMAQMSFTEPRINSVMVYRHRKYCSWWVY